MLRPERDYVGEYDDEWELEDAGGIVAVDGTLLGFASSRGLEHTHEGERPVPKRRCPACRWFEIAIVDTGEKYVIGRANRSAVPGEDDWFVPVVSVADAQALISELTQQGDRGPYLSTTVKDALSLAAEIDEAIDDVVNPPRPVRRL